MGAEVGTVCPLNAAATLTFLVALILLLFFFFFFYMRPSVVLPESRVEGNGVRDCSYGLSFFPNSSTKSLTWTV